MFTLSTKMTKGRISDLMMWIMRILWKLITGTTIENGTNNISEKVLIHQASFSSSCLLTTNKPTLVGLRINTTVVLIC